MSRTRIRMDIAVCPIYDWHIRTTCPVAEVVSWPICICIIFSTCRFWDKRSSIPSDILGFPKTRKCVYLYLYHMIVSFYDIDMGRQKCMQQPSNQKWIMCPPLVLEMSLTNNHKTGSIPSQPEHLCRYLGMSSLQWTFLTVVCSVIGTLFVVICIRNVAFLTCFWEHNAGLVARWGRKMITIPQLGRHSSGIILDSWVSYRHFFLFNYHCFLQEKSWLKCSTVTFRNLNNMEHACDSLYLVHILFKRGHLWDSSVPYRIVFWSAPAKG